MEMHVKIMITLFHNHENPFWWSISILLFHSNCEQIPSPEQQQNKKQKFTKTVNVIIFIFIYKNFINKNNH